jgi:hypothetical protein
MLDQELKISPSPTFDVWAKIILGALVMGLFYFIPNRWEGLPILPFEWAGITLVALTLNWRKALASLLIFQLTILLMAIFIQGYSIKSLLSLPGMMMAEIAAVVVAARCNEWKEAHLPWWNFMIAVLCMTIILVGSAFWMKALGDQNWTQLLKAMYTGILMLSAFLLMLQQLIWRLIKGREFYYKKK